MKRALAFGAATLSFSLGAGAAETTVDLSGTVPDDALRHFYLDFTVPAGTKEIQIHHDDLSPDNILDWGLVDASGTFRGWGGGNEEDAVVGEQAASRSYVPGSVEPGTWRVVVGKAQIKVKPATFNVLVTLRDAPTLAAQPERTPYKVVPALKQEKRWYAGDFHVHSIESGDAQPPLDDIATFARSRGLDFVEVSDHNTNTQLDFFAVAQKKHADLLFIPGVEFTTYWGHANGIGATSYVDDKVELPGNSIGAAVKAYHDQNALFSLNHPTLDLGDACIGCAWAQDLPVDQIDAVEIGTGKFGIITDSAVDYWDGLCAKGRHLAAVGGSDDHKAGQNETPIQSPIGSPTTLVYADELSVAGIMAGIKQARTVVKLESPADAMVELTSSVAPSGDTITAATTHLIATVTGGVGKAVRWVIDGEVQPEVDVDADPFTFEMDAKAPASGEQRIRVEVLANGKRRTVTSHLWLTAPTDADSGSGGGAGQGASGGGPGHGDSSDDGGCGCHSARGTGLGWGALSALALLGVAKGRRRRADSPPGGRRDALANRRQKR